MIITLLSLLGPLVVALLLRKQLKYAEAFRDTPVCFADKLVLYIIGHPSITLYSKLIVQPPHNNYWEFRSVSGVCVFELTYNPYTKMVRLEMLESGLYASFSVFALITGVEGNEKEYSDLLSAIAQDLFDKSRPQQYTERLLGIDHKEGEH